MRFTTYLPTNQRLLMTPEQVTTLMQGAITTYVELVRTQSRLDEEACHLALRRDEPSAWSRVRPAPAAQRTTAFLCHSIVWKTEISGMRNRFR